jgi:CRP-like cAMP-binding protein
MARLSRSVTDMAWDNTWPPATLLGWLSPATRAGLLTAGRPVSYPAHHFVLRQGDPGRHVLLLLDGLVKVVTTAEGGYEALLAIRVGGDLIGEMAALDAKPRSASAVTCSPLRARLITHAELATLLNRYGDVAIAIARVVSERLRWANRRRVDFGARDAPSRVRRVLVDLVASHGRQIGAGWDLGVALSQEELASLAGVSLASVQKVLQELARAGLVERHYRRIVVRDLAGLRTAAQMIGEIPY